MRRLSHAAGACPAPRKSETMNEMSSWRRWARLLPILALAAAGSHAAARTDDPSPEPPIAYRLSVPEPSRRELGVEMIVAGLTEPLDLRMSRTSPGRYALHEFAKNVFDVQASDGAGRPLAVDHVEASRWIV